MTAIATLEPGSSVEGPADPSSRFQREGAWLPKGDIARRLGITARAIQKRLDGTPGIISRKVKAGRVYRLEYAVVSLPPDIRAALTPAAAASSIIVTAPAQPEPAPEIPPGDHRWTAALAKADRVRRIAAAVQAAVASGSSRLKALTGACAAEGLSVPTYYRLSRAIQTGGVQALLHRNASLGKSRSLSPTDQAFLYSLYTQELAPLPLHIWEAYASKCQQEGRRPAHRTTIYRFLQQIPPSVSAEKRIGPEYWDKHYCPVVRRDPLEYQPGQTWNSDGRTSDVWVYLHTRSELERLWREAPDKVRIGRPELIWWMDIGSRYKWALVAATLTSEGVAESFLGQFQPDPTSAQHLIGVLPKRIYIDNGREYKNRYISGRTRSHKAELSPYQLGMMGNLGIEVTHAIVRNARAKAIERSFATDAARFDRYQPGYCGRDAKFRPEKLKRLVKARKLQSLDEYQAALDNYLAWYNAREHSATKAAPAVLWQQAPRVRVRRSSVRAILLKSGTALLRQDGIHLFGQRYWSDGLSLWIGEKVQVRWDPGDLSQLTVIHRGQAVTAACAEFMATHPTEADYRAANRSKKAARQAVEAYDAALRILVDPREALPHLRPQPPLPAVSASAVASALPLATIYDQVERQEAARAAERAGRAASFQSYADLPMPGPPPRPALKLLPDE